MNTAKSQNRLSEYDMQADAFLNRFGLAYSYVKTVPQECPEWATEYKGRETIYDRGNRYAAVPCGHAHGLQYVITISRKADPKQKVTFKFWNSLDDAIKFSGSFHTPKHPSAYDVLAGMAFDANLPDNFSEFCAEYGYSNDSIAARKTFERCLEYALKLTRFFTEEELKALEEIQ